MKTPKKIRKLQREIASVKLLRPVTEKAQKTVQDWIAEKEEELRVLLNPEPA